MKTKILFINPSKFTRADMMRIEEEMPEVLVIGEEELEKCYFIYLTSD